VPPRIRSVLLWASLLLGAAGAAQWARSHRIADRLSWTTVSFRGSLPVARRVGVDSSAGRLVFWRDYLRGGERFPAAGVCHQTRAAKITPARDTLAQQLGFGITQFERDDGSFDHFSFAIPCWLIVIPAAAAPCIALGRWMRGNHLSWQGRCRFCAYDLRGSEGRCPECGRCATKSISRHSPPAAC
jgi:hypothetical protein